MINEESDRLNRLVGEAAEVAQLDSHQLELHFELHSIHEPIDTALQAARQNLQRHPVDVKIPEKVPNIRKRPGREIGNSTWLPMINCSLWFGYQRGFRVENRTPQANRSAACSRCIRAYTMHSV